MIPHDYQFKSKKANGMITINNLGLLDNSTLFFLY